MQGVPMKEAGPLAACQAAIRTPSCFSPRVWTVSQRQVDVRVGSMRQFSGAIRRIKARSNFSFNVLHNYDLDL